LHRGFKKAVVPLIQSQPGLSAKEYAEVALRDGLCESDSPNPVFSLQTTLMKEVREGRMPGVKAVKVDGKLRYFPAEYDTTSIPVPHKDLGVSVLLPPDVAKYVGILVEVGSAGSHSEALIRLAREGIKAKRQDLKDMEKVVSQISFLKQSVSM
jgi:hypothetical protein